jgi:hypothetical protein
MSEQKKTLPTRSLFDPDRETQLPWTSGLNTDLKAKFEAIRRQMRQTKTVQLVRQK